MANSYASNPYKALTHCNYAAFRAISGNELHPNDSMSNQAEPSAYLGTCITFTFSDDLELDAPFNDLTYLRTVIPLRFEDSEDEKNAPVLSTSNHGSADGLDDNHSMHPVVVIYDDPDVDDAISIISLEDSPLPRDFADMDTGDE
jgi:hypothetical protein